MVRSVTPGATQPGEKRPSPDGSRPGCPRFPRIGRQPARLGRSPSRSTSSVRPQTHTCGRNRHNLASGPSLTSGPITQRERAWSRQVPDRRLRVGIPVISPVAAGVRRLAGQVRRHPGPVTSQTPCSRICRSAILRRDHHSPTNSAIWSPSPRVLPMNRDQANIELWTTALDNLGA